MNCGCNCNSGETYDLKIEGDVGADPIWCNRCNYNIDLEDVPISEELAEELTSWSIKYGQWINWDEDKLLPNGFELEVAFNQLGDALAKKVKQEIGDTYQIKFTPTSSAQYYSNNDK
jgi:hypothetical protein